MKIVQCGLYLASVTLFLQKGVFVIKFSNALRTTYHIYIVVHAKMERWKIQNLDKLFGWMNPFNTKTLFY